jgi:glycosyltransferase involved in cell wall biosynthesis
MIAAWLARVPVRIYQIRGLPIMTAGGPRRLALWCAEKTSCRLAHRVICISHSMAREAVRLGLCPAEKIRVLGAGGNGVDAEHKFNPDRLAADARTRTRAACDIPAGALVVGYIGRIVRDKGMVELAAAWRTLRERFPAAHLLLVGPFETQDRVPPEVESLFRGDPRIHLTGMVDDTPPYYAATDVLVLPTYREGLAGVLLEAGAMAVPAVATRIPGCVDAVVDGVTATLVPPRDPESLAQAVAAYLDDPALRRAHGRAAQQLVLRMFRRETVWEATYQQYVALLQARGLPVPEAAGAEETLSQPQRRAA